MRDVTQRYAKNPVNTSFADSCGGGGCFYEPLRFIFIGCEEHSLII